MFTVIAVVVALAVGFGIGRISAKKLDGLLGTLHTELDAKFKTGWEPKIEEFLAEVRAILEREREKAEAEVAAKL